MKTILTNEIKLNSAALALVSGDTVSTAGDFSSLVIEHQLNPNRDFRHADLSGVDFSGCDLRGFDFTGADLTKSHGFDVLLDHTTVLEKADVSGSIFQHEWTLRKTFEENSELSAHLRSLQGKHWTKIAEWTLDEVLQSKSKDHKLFALISRLFESFSEARGTILMAARHAIVDVENYRSFLLNITTRRDVPISTLITTLKALASSFRDDASVSHQMFSYMLHSDHRVRGIAISYLVYSKWAMTNRREFMMRIAEESFVQNRQFYLRTVLESVKAAIGINMAAILRDPEGSHEYLDWKVAIDYDAVLLLETMSRPLLTSPKHREAWENRELVIESNEVVVALMNRVNWFKTLDKLPGQVFKLIAYAKARGIPYNFNVR
jgi:Pentapeptide repeats (8 copies)